MKTLDRFGLERNQIVELAKARQVDVLIDTADKKKDWVARTLPWEYLIAGGTRPYRRGNPITITRSLRAPGKREPEHPSSTDALRVLYVESAPNVVADAYDFSGERDLIDIYLVDDSLSRAVERLINPTVDKLRERVASYRPHIVHVAGVDNHEAKMLVRWSSQRESRSGEGVSAKFADDAKMEDGYCMVDATGNPDPIGAKELAAALTGGGGWLPWLVCLGLDDSGVRVAPGLVSEGCGAVVGFQDAFNDELAEIFFGNFYSDLRTHWDPKRAFGSAWEVVRKDSAKLLGTGVILWTNADYFREPVPAERVRPKREDPAPGPDQMERADLEKKVKIDVVPRAAINYSLLHNGQTLFHHFSIKPSPNFAASSVAVRVTLSAGTESATFERVLDLDGRPVDLSNEVKVSLSSSLIRSIHEAIMTTLLVDVQWGRHVLKRDTYPVRILPVDQWQDAKYSRSWLPSFVFPRDRAVADLMTKAANYVRVVRDDPAAGFEGYQCVIPRGANKEVLPIDAVDVDRQVQAIWSAIVHEWRLTYVNPPPGYSKDLDSQRLRTPSMIARERQGTCIDLALFFAACLELVDIWPVIFLLKGHAFPGYWRDASFHERFQSAKPPDDDAMRDIMNNVDFEKYNTVAGAQAYPWAIGHTMRREIIREVREGRLVPLETVRLTENCGFAEAIEAGEENFADPHEFEFLIDIAIARQHQITPLPILGEAT